MNAKQILSSKLFKNSVWLLLLQVFNTIVPMITIPFVTRILGSTGYGVFSLALNWILYLQVIVEYGFAFWGARKVAMANEEQLQIIFSKIITSRLLLLVISFILVNVAYIFSGLQISHYYCMLLLFTMVIGTAFQMTWLFQGKQDMQFIAIVNAIARSFSVILIFIMINNRNDVYLYSFLYSITFILSSLIGLIVANKKYGLKIKFCNLKYIKDSLFDAWPLFISQAMSKILSGFGVTILGAFSTASTVGIYSAIYKIPYAMTLFFSPISQALYPRISIEFSKSKISGVNIVKKLSLLILPIFSVLAIIIILFRYQIVNIVFGDEYYCYSNILIPLCLWFILSVINNFLGIQILVASGHQKEYSHAFLISAVLSIVLNIILGYLYTINGVSWATTISEFILSLLLIYSILHIKK